MRVCDCGSWDYKGVKMSRGTIYQKPLYECINCMDYQSFPADHLRVHEGDLWCGECWGHVDVSEGINWADLSPFVPEIGHLDSLSRL